MMQKQIPLPHQQNLINSNPHKGIIAWETRCGKSLPAALWIDLPEQGDNTYIITLKKNKRSWQEMGTRATVLTKEESKKGFVKKPSAIVVDEAHHFASPLFAKGRSQLSTVLYTLIKDNPDCHILLLTATPVRNSPWSLHTLLCFVGIYYPWKEWREKFFIKQKLAFLPYPAWMPRSDWRDLLKPYYEKHCEIVNLKDVVEYLPPAETRIITIKQKPYRRPMNEIVTWHDEHKWEQQGKSDEILSLGYKKIIVVAYYTYQIDELREALYKEKPCYVLDGRTKDPETVIKQAQDADECYFIVQSSCGEGWDGWQFGAMVFASVSHAAVPHTQMLGRQRHPKHLKVTETIYLIGGRWDRKILDTVNAGKDFYEPS